MTKFTQVYCHVKHTQEKANFSRQPRWYIYSYAAYIQIVWIMVTIKDYIFYGLMRRNQRSPKLVISLAVFSVMNQHYVED